MSFSEIKIDHLKDYIEFVNELGRAYDEKKRTPPVLWFRGERCQDWSLRPSLIRDHDLEIYEKETGAASGRALQEEMRYQHYQAKNYHFLQKNPDTKLGWMELMQHHSVKTRLLDWSESMFHPLIFALECFFDSKNYRTEERIKSSPNIWVYEPIQWNRVALEKLINSQDVIQYCIESLESYRGTPVKPELRYKFLNMRNNLPDYLEMGKTRHLEGIFNLSVIEKDLSKITPDELFYLLENGEYFYCLFYLLKQVYLNTAVWDLSDVMPMAIVESYHSDRIRAQRGAFAIFPYYRENEMLKKLHNADIHLDAMENMDMGNQFLHRIRICNQEEIAFEIMNAGMNISWLYPEMPVVANAIENRKVIF